jgi:putative ABC transport system ATP-binding protein
MMTAPPLIRMEGVCRTFDRAAVVALDGIDLSIGVGDCIAILGASGSGKSSLINMISGIDEPSSGRILWHDHPVKSRREWAVLRRDHIGIVFQEFNLLPTLTAVENVEMALIGRSISGSIRRTRAVEALEQVGLAGRLHHLPAALSGGERQRVAIARSIVNEPKLLLADEPTGNLDSANAALIADLLMGLQESTAATLVLVTHDEKLASRCHRCVRIRDGRIVEDRVQPRLEPPREAAQ